MNMEYSITIRNIINNLELSLDELSFEEIELIHTPSPKVPEIDAETTKMVQFLNTHFRKKFLKKLLTSNDGYESTLLKQVKMLVCRQGTKACDDSGGCSYVMESITCGLETLQQVMDNKINLLHGVDGIQFKVLFSAQIDDEDTLKRMLAEFAEKVTAPLTDTDSKKA